MAYCPICGASVTNNLSGVEVSKWNLHCAKEHPTTNCFEVKPVKVNPFPKVKVVDLTNPMFDEKEGYD